MKINNESIGFKGDFAVRSMLKKLHQLIAKASRLNLDTKKMEDIYQDLNVLNLFSDRHIVSIAGLQSAGKTSLIKRFLGLPDDLLLSEVGVGEKRPVLISSSSSETSTVFKSVRMEKSPTDGFHVRKFTITKEEMNEGVQNPIEGILWFEIILPETPRLGHITLALLPGFERSSRSDSQKFLDLFLKCSTGMILVVNHARLAQMDQENLLKKVADAYKDKSPGFVLTYASELSEKTRRDIETSLMGKFGDIEPGQIILSDFDIDAMDRLERLLKLNSGYSVDSRAMNTQKMRLIGEELSMELTRLENTVEIHHSDSSEKRMLYAVLKEFQLKKERYLQNLDKVLDSALNGHANRCIERFADGVEGEKETVGDKFKAAFKKDLTFNERRAITKSISKVYSEDSSEKLDYLIVEAIETTAEKSIGSFKRYTSRQTRISETSKYLESGTIGHTSCVPSARDLLQQDVLESLQAVDQYLDSNNTEISLEARHVTLLPVIAGSILQGTVLSKTDKGDDRLIKDGIEEFKTLQQKDGDLGGLQNEYSDLLINTNMILKGATIFLGVDAIDGSFDSFGAIVGPLQAMGLSVVAAGSTAVLGIGGLFGAIAVLKGAEKIEKFKFDKTAYAERVLKATANYQKEHIISVVEGIMDDMRQQFMDAYEERHRIKGNMGLYEEITSLVHLLQIDCGKLREEAFLNASFIK